VQIETNVLQTTTKCLAKMVKALIKTTLLLKAFDRVRPQKAIYISVQNCLARKIFLFFSVLKMV
jgi:hypothetical protein